MRVIHSSKADTSAEMDAMRRSVAALRAAEACADDEVHKGLKKKERETYYAAIYDEDGEIQFPQQVARTATVLSGLDHLQDGQLAPKERFGKVFEVFIWWGDDDDEEAQTDYSALRVALDI